MCVSDLIPLRSPGVFFLRLLHGWTLGTKLVLTITVRNRLLSLLSSRVIAVHFSSPGKLLRDLEYKTGEYPKGCSQTKSAPRRVLLPPPARPPVQQGSLPAAHLQPRLYFLTRLLLFRREERAPLDSLAPPAPRLAILSSEVLPPVL